MTPVQVGVAIRIFLGVIAAIIMLSVGWSVDGQALSVALGAQTRGQVLGLSLLLPTLVLAVCIARLAGHRFFDPVDVLGSANPADSDRARVLQSGVQNTLEQWVVLSGSFAAWCLLMPISSLGVPLMVSVLFVLGRILFLANYEKGAVARAFGFALTFYPSVLMLLIVLVHRLNSLISF